MPILCQTETAVLLVGVWDARGVLRYPSSPSSLAAATLPGLSVNVVPLLPIGSQLVDRAQEIFGREAARWLDQVEGFADVFQDSSGTDVTLYVAYYRDPKFEAPIEWPTFPDLLRSLGGVGRVRVPYVRAFQVFQGGLTETTKVVEMSPPKG